MKDKFTLTLNSPITEEQWDTITDVDFEHTNEITFHTKHGKEVVFVKKSAQPEQRKKGKWIPVTRIEEWNKEDGLTGFPPEVAVFPNCTIKYVDATEPDEVDAVRCSECGTVYDFTEARNWCSECGADMRGEHDV